MAANSWIGEIVLLNIWSEYLRPASRGSGDINCNQVPGTFAPDLG